MTSSPPPPTTPRVDRAHIRQVCDVLFQEGDTHELRVLGGAKGTVSGYYDDFNKLADDAAVWSGKAEAVYITLNPCNPDLLARSANRVTLYARHTTADADILRRRWLLIDCDAKRPAGISSTAEERQAATVRALEADKWLRDEHGWTTPLYAASGNGGHLLFRVEEPNDEATATVFANVLKALAARFDDAAVEVDQKTFNASRICTLYGTLKAKGDHTEARPHRLTKLMGSGWEHGYPPEVVTRQQLEAVAALVPPPAPRPATRAGFGPSVAFDMQTWLSRVGLATTRGPEPYRGGEKWQLDCPFNPAHASPDATLFVTADGAAAFKCSHNSCRSNDWHALRDRMEPGWQEARRFPPANFSTAARPVGDAKAGRVPGGYSETRFFKLTEYGNAERLLASHGNDLRFSPALGWLVWDGKRWTSDLSRESERRMKATVRAMHAEADDLERHGSTTGDDGGNLTGVVKGLREWAKKSESASHITASLRLAESETGVYVSTDALDADPWALNCQNGTLDLRTGTLRPHDRNDLLTKMCGVEYDPEAEAPLWEQCLIRWQPDPEIRAFLQRAAGYTLTGFAGEETAFFCFGSGRNGKSKFVEALEGILADYAVKIPVETLMDARKEGGGGATPTLAKLPGARLAVSSEVKLASRLDESFIKDVTGGDRIEARRLYREPFEFKPVLKLWIYGNHKPQIRGTDDGIWARLPLIPWTVTIPKAERDTRLSEKLQEEWPGILAWAVRGCLEYQKQRLNPPAAVLAASDEYRKEMDPFADFFDACCFFGLGAWAKSADIREAYKNWSGEKDDKRIPSPNTFAERLRQLGAVLNIRKIDRTACRVWDGVGLKLDMGEGGQSDPNDPFGYAPTVTGVTGQNGLFSSQNKPTNNAPEAPVTPVTPENRGVAHMRAHESPFIQTAVTGVTEVTGVTGNKDDDQNGVEL